MPRVPSDLNSIWGAGQYCTVTRVARTMSSAQAQTAAESFLGSVQTIALVVQVLHALRKCISACSSETCACPLVI